MESLSICLIGDIVVDVTTKNLHSPLKMRMGGIIHAARCLWAMGIPFSVRYFAPSYLTDQITAYLTSLNCTDAVKLGDVTGAPYIFLIEEAKETGQQGYEFLLHDDIKIVYDEELLNNLRSEPFSDYIIISGNYNLIEIVNRVNGRAHIDVANNIHDLSFFKQLTRRVETIFISTSSDIFKSYFTGSFVSFCNLFEPITNQVIVKENRGGSRYYDLRKQTSENGYAQVRLVQHSVGVGDAYDAVFVCQCHNLSIAETLTLCSWIAAEYASTTYPDDFKISVQRILSSKLQDLVKIKGISVPWELRPKISIYLAAPDFDYVDVSPLNKLEENLRYHNFTPRRPVKENGQMEPDANKERRDQLFRKDMELLSDSSILIAVLLFNDPGTLIEIGLASAKGIPTFVYDPYGIAKNCMLTELPNLVTADLDGIISEVFLTANKVLQHGK